MALARPQDVAVLCHVKQVADEELLFKVLSGPELPRKFSGTRIASLPNRLLLTGGSGGDLGKEVGTKDVSKQKQKSDDQPLYRKNCNSFDVLF